MRDDLMDARLCFTLRLLLALFLGCIGANAGSVADFRLAQAAKNKNIKLVLALLNQNVDVNSPGPDGATALTWRFIGMT